MHRNVRKLVPGLLLISALALAACGSDLVRGEAPFVSVSSVSQRGGSVAFAFNLRNINDVPLDVDALAITVRSREATLLQRSGPYSLSVDPNTTEEIVFEHPARGATAELLGSLQSGAINSLPFSLDGRVHTAADGDLAFRHQGYLFRVPGRPGQFRATSTLAPDER